MFGGSAAPTPQTPSRRRGGCILPKSLPCPQSPNLDPPLFTMSSTRGQRSSHTCSLHSQSSTAVTHYLLIAAYFTDLRGMVAWVELIQLRSIKQSKAELCAYSWQAIMDRERQHELPALQLEWIDGICLPLYRVNRARVIRPYVYCSILADRQMFNLGSN